MKVNNLIIDGTNIEFKVFWIARKEIETDKNGNRIEVIKKFLPTFRKLIEKFDPDDVYMAWDRKLSPGSNFRKDLSEGNYKAGRKRPDDIKELYRQEPKLIEVLESFGVKHLFPNMLEADDVCAWLAHKLPGENIVVSADHDLLQLVNERTSVWNLKNLVTVDNFKQLHGVEPKNFKLYKAIKGDSSDNIPGIPGYGPVRASRLAEKWDISNIDDKYKTIVSHNLKMMDLDYGYSAQEGEESVYRTQFETVRTQNGDLDEFKRWCTYYNFESELAKFGVWSRLFKRNSLVDLINSLSI